MFSSGKTRVIWLRYTGLAVLVTIGQNAVTLRLPAAAAAPDQQVLTALGVTETVTNYDVLAMAWPVLFLLVADGVWSAWRRPTALTYTRGLLVVSGGAAPGNARSVSTIVPVGAGKGLLRLRLSDFHE